MKPVRIALIRHSVTVWNEENRIQGHMDSPLTKYGRELAEEWKKQLSPESFDAVITSDLGRTIETAEIITRGLDIPFLKIPGLREQDWGEWSGLTYSELDQKWPGQLSAEEAKGWNFRPTGGESRAETSARAIKALEEGISKIIEIIDNDAPKVLAIIHEGTLKSIAYKLAEHDYMPGTSKLIKRRRLHWIKWDGTLSIDRLNDLL
ncbi:probable phosphoglycerate mutase [Maridesulfovibrio ferrireducens]|uniref:Probable phosphoglycerate mutase n=1 Tax=Maridesulfovibrio ferrireducens TaxID=246191 RepID=A0A1G9HU83_9BACT|nr:histidine phosphatase family protein [Maridesulfovibrio ferrireducens]SDL16519.1 probable phosphoglycerate mutase [Maridesulfovibrio ferrireducens]